MPLNDRPQYNKQHAVPQNIMEVEFRLIGDLTMRQFFYVLIFFGLAYGVFNLGIPLIFKWPTMAALVILGLGFAFVPVEDRGLDEWLVNFFKAVFDDSQKIWHKEPNPPSAFLYENISAIQHELITLTPTASRRKLEQYLQDQYTQQKDGDPYDLLEASYIMKVKEAFAGTRTYERQAPTTVVVEEEFTPIEPTESKPIGAEETSKLQPKPALPKKEKEIRPKAQAKRLETKLPPAADDIVVRPITPDRHAGRRFTSLLPSQGTIVLPIRGERVLRPIEHQEPSVDAIEKAQQLKAYIEQVKGMEQTESVKVGEEAQKLIDKLQIENETLQKQIALLKGQGTSKQEEVTELEKRQKETVETIGKLKEQVSSLTTKLGEIPAGLQPERPNLVAGIVRNIQGRGLNGVLLVIKNSKNEPVRAIKTNDLGEFSISNPLINGRYKIEVDVNGATGFRFDIMEFDAKGEIIPAMEFVGK